MRKLFTEDERVKRENDNENDCKSDFEICGDLDDFIFSFVDYYGPSER